jgi:hypothetical protein
LIPVNPDSVSLYEAPDGSIFYNVRAAKRLPGRGLRQPLMIPEDDMFHLRDLGFNMLLGLSRSRSRGIPSASRWGSSSKLRGSWRTARGPPACCRRTRSCRRRLRPRLRTQWEALRAGIQNVGKTAILEEGVKWNAMQLSVGRSRVHRAARFWSPTSRAGSTCRSTSSASKARWQRLKFDDADQAYVNTTIMPDLDVWEQKFIQKFDLDEEGLVADFDERGCCAPRKRPASTISASRSCRASRRRTNAAPRTAIRRARAATCC